MTLVHGFGGAQCARLRQCKASTEVPAECGRRFGGGDRLLEGSGGHWCTASAVHSAHGFGSARRVLRYRPKVAAASAGAAPALRPRCGGRCAPVGVDEPALGRTALVQCKGEYDVRTLGRQMALPTHPP